MKKYLLALTMVLLSNVSFAQGIEKNLFDCNDGTRSRIQIRKDFLKDMAEIHYQFSVANLVCYNVGDKIKNEQEIVCSGMWSFDFDKSGGDLNTPVILTLKPLADGQWEAQYRTTVFYGDLPMQQTCSTEL